MNRLERTELMLGKEALQRLSNAHVAVFGLGGVGGYAVEALARSGIGEITVLDCDVFSESNLNRQLYATKDTVGQNKTQVTAERILSVAPDCTVHPIDLFYTPENAHTVDLSSFDYIIDAIDTVTSKIHLICQATEKAIPIISSTKSPYDIFMVQLRRFSFIALRFSVYSSPSPMTISRRPSPVQRCPLA